MTNGKVNIHGKEYSTVAYRIHQFRGEHPDWQIHTEVIKLDEDHVVMRCDICDSAGVHQATGTHLRPVTPLRCTRPLMSRLPRQVL
jgi:hypothetical protein